jgi:hypothetical protein
VNGTTRFGVEFVQITSRSDSRYPVMNCAQLQSLHRCALPIGVPFLMFNLPMTLLDSALLSGPAGGLLPGNKRYGTVGVLSH